MEIRCVACQHVGVAKTIRPQATHIELECATCGHVNILEFGASSSSAAGELADAPAAAPAPPAPATPKPTAPKSAPPKPAPPEAQLSPQALARMIPEPGDGLRCRKCAHRMYGDEDHCSRCGLGVDESRRYAPGQAPWERPPKGSEREHEQALLLWEAAKEDWTEENVENFAHVVRDAGLYETGIRLLRFRLIDTPHDALAITHLEDLAARLQSRIIVARAQAEVSAQGFTQQVARARSALMVVVLVFWGVIFVLFLSRFMDNCR